MENVNKQLLDALIIARKMLDDEGYFPVKEIDLAIAAAERAQQAEPVARDWSKLLEMARQIIRDGHVHDVGGGDLAVTTCEAFEGLDAFLKQHFPEPLGELTETERKWFEAKAAAQPPAVAVPDAVVDSLRHAFANAARWGGHEACHQVDVRAMLAAMEQPK